jgi:hypothetical protein
MATATVRLIGTSNEKNEIYEISPPCQERRDTIDCTNRRCRRGRIKEYGFDGWDDHGPCPDCDGTGELVLTPEESALMGAFLESIRVALTCEVCRHHRDLHDDGECPVVIPFPVAAAPRPAA